MKKNDIRKIVIFGNSMSAELIAFLIQTETSNIIAGFTVSKEYYKSSVFMGKPNCLFEEIESHHDMAETSLVLPMGFYNNHGRYNLFNLCQHKGYSLYSFISKKSAVADNCLMGSHVLIYEKVLLQPFSKIGSNIILRSGVNVSHHVEINEHVSLAPGVIVSGGATIKKGAVIGSGAIINDGVTVGEGCVIGSGSVVTKNTDRYSLYAGVPAKKIKSTAPNTYVSIN